MNFVTWDMFFNWPVLMTLAPKIILFVAIGVLLNTITGRHIAIGIYIFAVIVQMVLSLSFVAAITYGGVGALSQLTLAMMGLVLEWIAPVTLLLMALKYRRDLASAQQTEWSR